MAPAKYVQGMGSGIKMQSVLVPMPTETLKGEVATVDEASGKISIKLSSTVGSSNATTPTYFKVQDGLVFNAIKPGDKVSFTAERKGEETTIMKLTRE